MLYGPDSPRPPRGSTAWGAAQFYRLLDEEERAAARERPLANGERSTPWLAAMASLGLSTRAGGGRFPASAPPQDPSVVTVFDPGTTQPDFDLLISRSAGRVSAVVAAYIQIAITLTYLLTRTATTRDEWEALQRKREAAEFAYRRLTHMMAARFSREELERIREDSGVDFDLVDRALRAPAAAAAAEESRPAQESEQGWAADPAWISLFARDIPEDDDYCQRRWGEELSRCGRWKPHWARRGCAQRAGDRFGLCRRNGGAPDPREPDEWSEKDMERWYNPYR